LQKKLSNWANDGAPELTTLWLNGMAGTGKSAISTTFAQNMDDEGLLGATFFIDRQVADRTDPRRIVQSLAYDLAERDTNRLRALWLALREKPTIKEMPLREQVQALIKRPLDETCTETLVIVIDGLDECVSLDGTQLLSTLVACLSDFPIKLLVSSRSEPAIVRSFGSILHNPIPLQEQPADEVAKDVRLYWEHSLDQLCLLRGAADWRPSVSVDHLVQLTGLLFIYASTVLKVVQIIKHDPIGKLTEFLAKVSTGTSLTEVHGHSLLDDLYLRIVTQAVSDDDGTVNSKYVHRLRAILEVIIFARRPLTPHALSQLLNIDVHELNGYLSTLVSVLVIPDTSSSDGVVRPLHQSFPDFVCQYSGQVHHDLAIDAVTANAHLTEHCLSRLNKELHFDMCNIRDPSLFNREVHDLKDRVRIHVSLALRYSCEFWAMHCLNAVQASGPQREVLLGLLDFCNAHLLHWIELLSLIDGLDDILRIMPTLLVAFVVTLSIISVFRKFDKFSSLQHHQQVNSNVFRALLSDAVLLMKTYSTPVSSSALHVYHSGVVSMPHCTLSTQVSHPLVGRLVSQRNHGWPAGPTLLEGHTDKICSVTFSPDGSQIISGSRDHTVRVWYAVSGAQKHTLEGHTDCISSAAFSLNGAQMISGSWDSTVRVWDAVSGAHKHTLKDHTGPINSVAFSPDSSQIISGSWDGTVRVWDAVSGAQRHTLKGHTDWIYSVAFSPNGSQIISGSDDCTVRLWDAVSGEDKHTLSGHTARITSVAFSPDGSQIISGSFDQTVRVWDPISGAHTHTLRGHTDWITYVAFSPDGSQIISGSDDNTVRLWDAVSGARKHTLSGHNRLITSVAFSSDGSQVISGSNDCTVRVWDAVSGENKHTLSGHTNVITSVAFSPDGSQIISGSDDNIIRVWDATMLGESHKNLAGDEGSKNTGVYLSDGSQSLSGSDDRSLQVRSIISIHKSEQHSFLFSQRFQAHFKCFVRFSRDLACVPDLWDKEVRQSAAC
jgi:WD40 repeat protein